MKHIKIKFLALLLLSMLCSIGVVWGADVTPPSVTSLVSIIHTDQSSNMAQKLKITAAFSEPMDPSTITIQTFRVIAPDGDIIPGVVSYDPNTQVARFASFTNLEPQITYTATLTRGMEDLAGNPLDRTFSWTFNREQLERQVVASPVPKAPVVIPAATPQPQVVSEGYSPLLWLLGLLLVILVIWLGYSIFVKKETKQTTPRKNPFGDVHPIINIEGIGPEYTERLKAIGINNTKDLWEADASSIAKKIDVSTATIEKWQQMAELIAVSGIGPQYAELLQRSGIKSIVQLASSAPKHLLARVRRLQDSLKIKIQGSSLNIELVNRWIKSARNHFTA
ncbi:MAG: DUF4332 domain-containing protein [Nanoarchaeota archaeon]|nr:DUF4332 domain-containing protein [Nanoarchaeota archaeon]